MRFFVIGLLLLLGMQTTAQQEPSKWKTQNIVVNDPDVTVKASIQNKARAVKPQNDRVYAWYKSGKIIETQGGSHGKLLEGNYAAFYLNDQLKEQGAYKNGLREGEWRTWDVDGRLTSVKHYNNGLLHGTASEFDTEGRPTLEANYKNGKLEGDYATYLNGEEQTRQRYRKGEEHQPKQRRMPWQKKQPAEPVAPEIQE